MSDERNILNGGNGDDLTPQSPEDERLEALLAAMPRRHCPPRVRESVMAALRGQVEAESAPAARPTAKVVSLWFGPRVLKALEIAAVLAVVAVGFKVYRDVRPRVGIVPTELAYKSPAAAPEAIVLADADSDRSKAEAGGGVGGLSVEPKLKSEKPQSGTDENAALDLKAGKSAVAAVVEGKAAPIAEAEKGVPPLGTVGGDFLNVPGAAKDAVQVQIDRSAVAAGNRPDDLKQSRDYADAGAVTARKSAAEPQSELKETAQPPPVTAAPAAKPTATAPPPPAAPPAAAPAVVASGTDQAVAMKVRGVEEAPAVAVAAPPVAKQPAIAVASEKKADAQTLEESLPAVRRIEQARSSTPAAEREARARVESFGRGARGPGVAGQAGRGKAAEQVAEGAAISNAPALEEARGPSRPESSLRQRAVAKSGLGQLEKGVAFTDELAMPGGAGSGRTAGSSAPVAQMPKGAMGGEQQLGDGVHALGAYGAQQSIALNGQWQMATSATELRQSLAPADRLQRRFRGVPSPPADLAWFEIETSSPVREQFLERNAITNILAPPPPAPARQTAAQDNRETTWTAFSQKALASFGRLVGEFNGRITDVQEVVLVPGARRALMVQCTVAAANGNGLLNTVNQKRMAAVSNSDLQQAADRLDGFSVTRIPSNQAAADRPIALNTLQSQRGVVRMNDKELAGNSLTFYSNFFVQVPPPNRNWNVDNRQAGDMYFYSPNQQPGGAEPRWGANQAKYGNVQAATPLSAGQVAAGPAPSPYGLPTQYMSSGSASLAAGFAVGQTQSQNAKAGIAPTAPPTTTPTPETVLYFVLEPDPLPATAAAPTQNQLPRR